jgi:ABC-type glycerol-3-phosphate transport system substrate-binding protein
MQRKRITAYLVVAALVLSVIIPVSFADNGGGTQFDLEALLATLPSDLNSYETYLNGHTGTNAAAGFTVRGETITVERESASSDIMFTVPESGFYSLRFEHRALSEGKTDIIMGFSINGEIPFSNAANMGLKRKFMIGIYEEDENQNEVFRIGKMNQDHRGNDIRPETKEDIDYWNSYIFHDREGLYNDPYRVYLERGEHALTFINPTASVEIQKIEFIPPPVLPSYEEYWAANGGDSVPVFSGAKDVSCAIEAETPIFTNSIFIGPTNDMSSPYTTVAGETRNDAARMRLNVFGQNWNLANGLAAWEITVPETARYRLSFRYKQDVNQGIRSYRRLYINGETPFAEAAAIAFPFRSGWGIVDLEYDLFLEAGTHTLALEAVLSTSGAVVSLLRQIVVDQNYLYRRILILTGSDPDPVRDYDLQNKVPNLIPDLIKIRDNLEIAADIISVERAGENVSQLQRGIRIIDQMLERPENITRGGRLGQFKNQISVMGAVINEFQTQPLILDKMLLSGDEGYKMRAGASFFDEVGHRWRRFTASFSGDQNTIKAASDDDNTEAETTISVWLDASVTGRDQANVLRSLIDQDFTPNHPHINVELSLVTATVVEATLAGKGPDIALNQGDASPVNFAIREALVDLRPFIEREPEIRDNFVHEAFVPYKYKDGIFAMPERMGFSMMFYRIDIFNQLGITPPETWDELIRITLPILNSNNLQAGIGPLGQIANASGSSIFTNLLYQRGGQIYTDDLMRTTFESQLAFDCFRMGVDFYTDYQMPRDYNEISRFRTGEMPLMISNYTLFNVFAITVPELNGLWRMIPIPGTMREDGVIDRSQPVTGMASVMLKGIDDPEAGWQFLKWWTSERIQAAFGVRQEATIGPAGRYDTANIKALSGLPWEERDLEQIYKQLEWARCVPQLPGSYYTSRALNTAFTLVVEKRNENQPRETLMLWNEMINSELERKRREFDFDPREWTEWYIP